MGKVQAGDLNRIDTANPWRELIYIEAVFRDTTHLSFNATFYLTDVDTVTVRDTLAGTYKISKNKYYIGIDSTVIVQNDFYHLTLYTDQHLAILNRPSVFGLNLFQVNLTDPVFNQTHVDYLHETDSGAYRKISFQFKTGSPYRQFDIIYDTASHHITSVEYDIKKNLYDGTTPDHYYHMRAICTSYQTGTFTDAAFSMTPYFIRKNGIYSLVSPYGSYQLINNQ
jgi:hypothetical protein